MRSRPMGIQMLALALALVAFALPAQVLLLRDPDQFFLMMTDLNWLTFFALLTTSYCVYHLHPRCLEMLTGTSLLVVLNNYWVGSIGFDYSYTQAMLGAMGFLALHTLLLEPKTLQLLMNPQLKWWDVPKRQRVDWSVDIEDTLQIANGPSARLNLPVFDASENGLFVKVPTEFLNQFRPGESLHLVLRKDDGSSISAKARIVRMTTGHGAYPQGMGLALSFDEPRKSEDNVYHLRAS